MADYALIDGYLETLRSSIRWRRDLDDVIAEMEDHLLSAAQRLEARGSDRVAAQRDTLDRFGDPDVLAVAFASTPSGGIAVPTSFTKATGNAAIASAIAWLAALGMMALSAMAPTTFRTDPSQFIADAETVAYMISSSLVLLAGVLMGVMLVGLMRRHGGLGVAGMIGLGLTVFGVATSFFTWAVWVWLPLMGVGLLIFSVPVHRRGIAPKAAVSLLAGGMLTGAVLLAVLSELEVGRPDEWGDYPLAAGVGLSVGLVTTALALWGIGRWLRREEPAELPGDPLAVS